MLLTNSRSGPGGQEGPLPGPLPSTGAEAGRGTSAVQIVISCRRTVAETREAELGGGKTGAGFSQPPPACIHTHTHTHTHTHSLSLSLSLSFSLPLLTATYSHAFHKVTHIPLTTHTHTLLPATYLHILHQVTHRHTDTHQTYTHMPSHTARFRACNTASPVQPDLRFCCPLPMPPSQACPAFPTSASLPRWSQLCWEVNGILWQ